MSTREWPMSCNPFLSLTEESYTAASTISLYHDRALSAAKTDATVLNLYKDYHPIHLTFQSKFDLWKAQGGIQQGDTLNLNQMLHLLSNSKIKQWDIKIQNIYPQETAEYKRLLPNRRKPFQNSGQAKKISAVNELLLAIGDDDKLAGVKTDIETFYTQLDASRNLQKESLNTTKSFRNDLEKARVAMCTQQFMDLGALIQKYPSSPEIINTFFDLQTIQSNKQVLYKSSLKPNEAKTIFKHTFDESDEILLTNSGNTQLKFYLAQTKDQLPGTKFIELGKGEQLVLASALGSLENTYLKVINTDINFEGAYMVEIV